MITMKKDTFVALLAMTIVVCTISNVQTGDTDRAKVVPVPPLFPPEFEPYSLAIANNCKNYKLYNILLFNE
jgi:hypothetical protein